MCISCTWDRTKKPAEQQLLSGTATGEVHDDDGRVGMIDEPRSLILAEIHADPCLIDVPAP